ncbi:MAG TPA: YbaN family protein [Arenicellales bacterium]|nr:hypothetical protein [Gammaproteobacteria bacterium]MDP6026276.1 YbaN family protein [Pseudomonadales bacterium]MDP7451340.1 YbaN family protein [Arenicellales bacterium]MDP7314089.1 YbaN family protein [Pseudomonadales bacterium]MDP7576846.1 YbaN family protein [Pseudomonadales bacterium]
MARRVYKVLGFVFFGLAIIGVLLPIVPATPFLLLSAWFFARSSEKWHQWLLKSELFGFIVRNWEENRCISLRTKIVAITGMVVLGGISITFAVDDIRLKGAALLLMLIGSVVVLSIKTCGKPVVPQK